MLSLRRAYADYFNDIRAGCLDKQLDTLLMDIRDEIKRPEFEAFIQYGNRSERERLTLHDMRNDFIDAINLYHADTIPMPKPDIVSRVAKLRDAIERKDDGDLHGPMWVVEYNMSMGRHDYKEAGDALESAQSFEHKARTAEAVAKALKTLGAGTWRE